MVDGMWLLFALCFAHSISVTFYYSLIMVQVPSREAFVSKSAEVHCFVVVVDYKVVGAVYAVDLSIDEAKEMNTAFQVSSVLGSKRLLSELTASRLVFFTLNPIFNVHAKGILKEVMRHLDVDTLLYRDDKSKSNPDPQTCVMENVIQIKPRHFVFGSDNSKRGTYALYAMNRRDFSKNRDQINHRMSSIFLFWFWWKTGMNHWNVGEHVPVGKMIRNLGDWWRGQLLWVPGVPPHAK